MSYVHNCNGIVARILRLGGDYMEAELVYAVCKLSAYSGGITVLSR